MGRSRVLAGTVRHPSPGETAQQVFKHGTELVGENAAQLHALRIACKKLRYCVEMFGSLFNDSKTKDYVAVLSELQDILGTLNDIAVAHRLLNELDNAARHDTLALIRGWMEHDYAVRVAEFAKPGNALQGKRNFGAEHRESMQYSLCEDRGKVNIC